MKRTLFASLLILSAPAYAEIYKCPDPNGRLVLQQLPCDGGQAVAVNAPKPASGETGMRASELATLHALTSARLAAAEAHTQELMRQEALAIERDKAAALHEQASETHRLGSIIAVRRWGW